MVNPVKKRIYIPKDMKPCNLLKSGEFALAEYSMLNSPLVGVYATDSIMEWNKVMTNRLQNSNLQVALEFWRYNPFWLAKGNVVDPLSLALSLKNEEDERIEECVEKMLDTLWRKLNGSRN